MLKAAGIFSFVVLLVAALAWLTFAPEDPCEEVNPDVGAAVLAGDSEDQDALVNTAILRRAKCPPEESDPTDNP